MKNRKWLRPVIPVLAAAMLAGTVLSVGAARYMGDVSGDGKITAFDAQLLAESNAGNRTLSDTQKTAAGSMTLEAIMDYIFGNKNVDVGDLNTDGVYEVYTAEGLRYMAQHPTASYVLTADLDLEGADWTPIQNFSGSFNGNGHTISNFTINTSVADSRKDTLYNQGFFGDTETTAVISDLHLRNVTLTADEKAGFVGFFAGTLRGQLTGCTVTGTLSDPRQTHAEAVYAGVMAGRLAVNSGGSIVGGTSISITDELGQYTTENLCANIKLFVTNRENFTFNGLTGYAPTNLTVTGQYTDTTNTSQLLTPTIRARQAKVVDYMNAMATVQWTPAEDLFYTAHNGTDQNYYAGTVYTGLPYNHHNGSMERFMAYMDTQDENGVYTAVSGLESGGYDATTQTWSENGFYLTMGNDCSSAVGWSWMRVTNVMAADVDTHNTPYKGGAFVVTTNLMVPNAENRAKRGIYQVGSWTECRTTDPETGKLVSAEFDTSKAAYQCTDEKYTADILANNGKDVILEAYAQAHKADAVVCYTALWSVRNASPGGHARLLTADPVVIRNADGSIDAGASYMLLTEQGIRFTADSTSHWNLNKKHTFQALTATDENGSVTNASKTYVPVTIRALREDYIRDTYITMTPAGSIVSPVEGGVYSYNYINSVTVTVTDEAGNVYYDHEAFTGVGVPNSIYRAKHNSANMADLHGSTFQAAAMESGMAEGQTYYFTVDVLLSTGEVFRMVNNTAFTYTPAAAE